MNVKQEAFNEQCNQRSAREAANNEELKQKLTED